MDQLNDFTYRRMLKARSLLDGAYSSFDLPRIARELTMSPGSFVRTFREAFGESPYRYVLRRRVERACLLLQESTEPVADIGFSVGFVDRAAFDRAFAEIAGSSPEGYRHRNRAVASRRS